MSREEFYTLAIDFVLSVVNTTINITRFLKMLQLEFGLNFIIGVSILLGFAAVLIIGVLFLHRGEIKNLFPTVGFLRGAYLYLATSPAGKHALVGIMFFVGVGGVLFGFFYASNAVSNEPAKLSFLSDVRLELGIVRAADNPYGGEGVAPEWVSHGVISFSMARYKCVDARTILWFHQSAAFSRDLTTMDASGLTISCTIPLNGF